MKDGTRQSGKRQFAIKKAYEISYAVFRVGSRITNAALKEHLERQALSLLDAATVENYGWISTVSKAIEYLIRFGGDVGLIHEANKETIIFQLQALNAGITGPEKTATAEEVSLGDIFSNSDPLFHEDNPIIYPAKTVNAANKTNPAILTSESGNGGSGEEIGANAEIRQTAIVELIRQSGNCRLRDVLETLPDYSERTIRYDLQTLVERGVVERVGAGGPSVFYRIRQIVPESASPPQ